MSFRKLVLFFAVLAIAFTGCNQKVAEKKGKFELPYEKYTLANGLEVILHEDKSDPIASVAIQYHVGSNRETKGRTGFAHLFEHMMFQESQHVGQDQFFKKIQDAGGTLNGGTGNDGTVYYEIVPKNALEMVLWMEADRMGYLLSTVTLEAFRNQQEVVMNEKRQRVDNRPYGHTGYILSKMLYPENHPYNWQVIGSMEDLTNATLKDVHEFYKKWYRPSNATLVVAGDFDNEQTRQWIEKYFGEIKSEGEALTDPEPQHVKLEETRMAYFEDNFAKSPELTMVFPSIQQYHKDAYALSMLGDLIAGSKKSPLYKVVVEEEKLAPSVSCYQRSSELTGEFRFRIRTFPTVSLTDARDAIFKALEKFEVEKFTEQDLERIKARTETGFYNGVSSVLGKSFQLGRYNEYAGSPDFISTNLDNIMGVTSEDIWRVYNTYLKDKNYVMTSFVPKGKTDLIVKDSSLFEINEKDGVIKDTADDSVTVEKTATAFDRSVEPAKGTDPKLTIPAIWENQYANGLKVLGIEHNELPLVSFSITLKGGRLFDTFEKAGVANMISDMMMEGTKHKTPVELEEAIDSLGAFISVYTQDESITINANTLASKFDDVVKLVQEILLEPRWDEKEFDRIKQETIEQINRSKANPGSLAGDAFNKLVYGKEHILGMPFMGTAETVEKITIDDLKTFYNNNFSPSVTFISITGQIDKEKTVASFQSMADIWQKKDVTLPEFKLPEPAEKAAVYFVDVPGSKQSHLRVGCLALSRTDADYYPATVMNYKLGGSFNGIVNLILREEKGYTYGARSGFIGKINPAPFIVSTSVQSNATLESLEIIRDEMEKYKNGISDEDLMFTKNALIKSNSRRFETLGALEGMLSQIEMYGLGHDYIKKEESIIRDMTADLHKALAGKYLKADKMIYLVVGDAESQMKQLKKLGFGEPVKLDINNL